MEFYWTAEGNVVLSVDDAELTMSRPEAEEMFVMLGHTLQDMDMLMNRPFDNHSDDLGDQP